MSEESQKPKKHKPTAAELAVRYPNGQATVEQIKNAWLKHPSPSVRKVSMVLQEAGFQTSDRDVGSLSKVYNETGVWPTARPKCPPKVKKSTMPEIEKPVDATPVAMVKPLGNDPADIKRIALEKAAAALEAERKMLVAQGGGELETTYKKELLAFSTLLVRTGAARVEALILMPSDAGALLKNCADVADKVKLTTGKPVESPADESAPVAEAPVRTNAAIDFLEQLKRKNGAAPAVK